MRRSACRAPRGNVMSLRNDRYPRLTSETTRKGENLLINTRAQRILECRCARARKRMPIFRCMRLSTIATSILRRSNRASASGHAFTPNHSSLALSASRFFSPPCPGNVNAIRSRREDRVNISAIIDARYLEIRMSLLKFPTRIHPRATRSV